MQNSAISVKNLNVKVDRFKLTNINLELAKGSIMGFVGKNGAGKTTFIKTLFDIIRPISGEIYFDGKLLEGNEETVKNSVGIVYDSPIFPLNISPLKIANMVAPFYKKFNFELWHSLMKRFELSETKYLSSYSKGMQMKFSTVMAISHEPDILILDEPSAGLDPVARIDMLDLLLEFMQTEDKTIFFSTHITSDLDKIADYITLIDNGHIIFSESKENLLDTYMLVHVEKESMTDTIKSNLTGVKESVFGYEGLSSDRQLFENSSGLKIARPTIEDIIVYGGGFEDVSK